MLAITKTIGMEIYLRHVKDFWLDTINGIKDDFLVTPLEDYSIPRLHGGTTLHGRRRRRSKSFSVRGDLHGRNRKAFANALTLAKTGKFFHQGEAGMTHSSLAS